jgi:HD-like signal output (HDOD) protein
MSVEAAAGQAAVPEDLQRILIERLGDLNMLPGIARQAMDIAQDPQGSIEKFAHVVERDVKLAADILVLANSAIYSKGKPVPSLHLAIMRLGFRQCKNLILASSVTALRRKMSGRQEAVQEILWQHGYTTAMLAFMVNKTLGLGFQGEEYTAGLVHDLGRTLFCLAFPEQFSIIDPLTFEETAAVVDHERNVALIDHCSLGAWFVESNQFPASLVEAVRLHHHASLPHANQKLTLLVTVADHMANHLQRFKTSDKYEPGSNTAVGLLKDNGVPQAEAMFRTNCHQMMDQALKEAREMMAL